MNALNLFATLLILVSCSGRNGLAPKGESSNEVVDQGNLKSEISQISGVFDTRIANGVSDYGVVQIQADLSQSHYKASLIFSMTPKVSCEIDSFISNDDLLSLRTELLHIQLCSNTNSSICPMLSPINHYELKTNGGVEIVTFGLPGCTLGLFSCRDTGEPQLTKYFANLIQSDLQKCQYVK